VKAVNLIPAEERRGGSGLSAGRSGGAVFAVFGLIAGLAVLALLYGTASHQISNDKAEVASLQARTAQAQARATALSPYTSFVTMREQREHAVEQLVDSRFDWARAFHELGRVLPADVSLSALSGTIGSSGAGSSGSDTATGAAAKASAATGASSASSVSSATPPGSVPIFTLAGCTTSQANVAIVLDRLRLIEGVQEVTLQSSTKAGASGSGGGGGGASGSCEGNDAVFNLTITFDALPTVPTSGSVTTTTTVAATSGGSSTGAAR
jgi:Tfp pilus assembly protein PilN